MVLILMGTLFAANLAEAAAPVTLVRDGQPAAVIVLADAPTASAQQGATQLQSWLRKASGATVPIRSEEEIGAETGQALILVGDTRRTAALGLRTRDFELEEVRIRSFPGVLAILGDDARPDGVPLSGTLWAVETFAERFLGVRVLWPGPLGEVVPRRRTIAVNGADVRHVPLLRQRKIRNIGYHERIQAPLEHFGWSAEAFGKHHAEAEPWFQFQRLGGSFEGRYGHAFGDYWERFHKWGSTT